MFAVYILYSESLDKYYIGFTTDLEDRVYKHNNTHKGFTAAGKPWRLAYSESFPSNAEAMKRERQLKSWKNRQGLSL